MVDDDPLYARGSARPDLLLQRRIDCAALERGMLAPTPVGGGSADQLEDEDSLLRADHSLEIHENC